MSLSELRRRCGFSQWDLALELQVNPVTISRWERLPIKPQPRHRRKLREILGEDVVGVFDPRPAA